MFLKNVNKAVILDKTVYIPESVYLSWTPTEQVAFVSGQALLC